MRAAAWIVVVLGAAIASGKQPALSAEVRPSSIASEVTPRFATTKVWRRAYHRPVAYKRARPYIARRTIGMPCVLPPNVIVQRDWNGPQCRWIDNVIPGDRRLRLSYW